MKKLITVLVLVFTLGMNAQKVGEINLEDIPVKYVELVAEQKAANPYQVKVHVDYGQLTQWSDMKKAYILSEDGKVIKFNGNMDALNLMESKGYKFISQCRDTRDAYRYILENTNYKSN